MSGDGMTERRVTDFEKAVYEACKSIPKGKVSTYSSIAFAIGRTRGARAVGNALNRNPFASVPCHRVVRSDGSVGGFAHGTAKKAAMLKAEGVAISDGKVTPMGRFFKPLTRRKGSS